MWGIEEWAASITRVLGGDMRPGDATSAAIVEAVKRLPVPCPFGFERFIRALGDSLARPVKLVGAPLGGSAPCGWLMRTSKVDYVCYPTNTSWLHQLHIVLHEIGHLVLGHSGDALLLGHSQGDSHDERDAETFATMAARRIARVNQWIDWDGPQGADVIALGDVFDVPSALEERL